MDRSEVVRQIIMSIKNLKEETNSVLNDAALLDNPGALGDSFYEQVLNPMKSIIKSTVRQLPVDEYIAIELDAWIKVLFIKRNNIISGIDCNFDEAGIAVYNRIFTELINTLTDLKLEIIESEFDARIDNIQTGQIVEQQSLGPNTLMVSQSVIAALITLLYNFNLIKATADIDSICKEFSLMTGYSTEGIQKCISLDKRTGRLKSLVSCDDLIQLRKIMRSMLTRLDYVISYISEQD